MDKYARLREQLKKAVFVPGGVQLLAGMVKEINGDTCTVDFGTITITGVRLKVQKGGENDKLILFPSINKMVLCGSLTGDMRDLVVLKSERVAKLEYAENGMQITIDSQSGKVAVKNETVSLKDLFDDLKTIIENLKVFTPTGPSEGVLPDSVLALAELQTKINSLLS